MVGLSISRVKFVHYSWISAGIPDSIVRFYAVGKLWTRWRRRWISRAEVIVLRGNLLLPRP